MAHYVCYNSKCGPLPRGFHFASEQPVCPKCGIRQDEPRYGRLIVEACVVHFEAPGKAEGYGVGYAACAGPGMKTKGPKQGEPSVVTCDKCKETDAYKAAIAVNKAEVVPDKDFKVALDMGAGVVRRVEE